MICKYPFHIFIFISTKSSLPEELVSIVWPLCSLEKRSDLAEACQYLYNVIIYYNNTKLNSTASTAAGQKFWGAIIAISFFLLNSSASNNLMVIAVPM